MNDKIKKLARVFKEYRLQSDIKIMEVCGTHTREFFRTGVRDIFPKRFSLVDGPGCPVCVTPNEYLDRAIEIGKRHDVILCTFGDMIKVPSSYSSLGRERSQGMNIEICYSPMDALETAANTDREVIFLSLGFETTAPAEAAVVLQARKRNIKNFSLLCGNKITVPAVKALLDAGDADIDGFILPGHVSAVIGADAWKFIPEKYDKPGVVAGFEDYDLLRASVRIMELVRNKSSVVVNEYSRAVRDEGNKKALETMYEVFEPVDSIWRGLGLIPVSGLGLREEYAGFDAEKRFPVTPPEPKKHTGCRCGELLRGLIKPTDCPLFGKTCTPELPAGPCMVSSEGPCSAYYLYG